MAAYKKIGELYQHRKRYEWRITNFWELSRGPYFSESFKFDYNEWYLELLPNRDQNSSWVEVQLHRVNQHLKTRVKVSFGIIRPDGGYMEVCDRENTLNEGQTIWGTVPLLYKPTLFENPTMWVSFGTLTIICYIRSEIVEGDEVESMEDSVLAIQSHSRLRCHMQKMFEEGFQADITFRVRGTDFLAHRSILSARSPVFKSMLAHDMSERNTGIITIDDFEPSVFRQFLYYVYTGDVPSMTIDNAVPLFFVADKYDFALLKDKCAHFLDANMSSAIVCDVARLAILYKRNALLMRCIHCFADHLSEIVESEPWMEFLKEDPVHANEIFKSALKLLQRINVIPG